MERRNRIESFSKQSTDELGDQGDEQERKCQDDTKIFGQSDWMSLRVPFNKLGNTEGDDHGSGLKMFSQRRGHDIMGYLDMSLKLKKRLDYRQ